LSGIIGAKPSQLDQVAWLKGVDIKYERQRRVPAFRARPDELKHCEIGGRVHRKRRVFDED